MGNILQYFGEPTSYPLKKEIFEVDGKDKDRLAVLADPEFQKYRTGLPVALDTEGCVKPLGVADTLFAGFVFRDVAKHYLLPNGAIASRLIAVCAGGGIVEVDVKEAFGSSVTLGAGQPVYAGVGGLLAVSGDKAIGFCLDSIGANTEVARVQFFTARTL